MSLSATKQNPIRRVVTLAAVCTVLAAAGCGDSDPENGHDNPPGAAATQAETTSSGTAGAKPPKARDPRFDVTKVAGDREQAQVGASTVESVYDDLGDAVRVGAAATDVAVASTLDDADGNAALVRVCDLLSAGAKRQAIDYARRSSGLADVKWTCEKATSMLLRRARQTGGLKRATRAQVIGVNADDKQATATVRFGGKRGHVTTVPLVKEDGTWKLAQTPTGG